MAKPVPHHKSTGLGKFVSIDMFRELESEVSQLRDTLENIRHESSANLRRCGELQFAVDELKKGGRVSETVHGSTLTPRTNALNRAAPGSV